MDRALITFLVVVAIIVWKHRQLAEMAYIHYKPLFQKNRDAALHKRWIGYVILFLTILFSFFMATIFFPLNREFQSFVIGNSYMSAILLIIAFLYLLWSIPGYYRWKKTGKGIELALFVAKLSIGILTIMGVVLGYALGKI